MDDKFVDDSIGGIVWENINKMCALKSSLNDVDIDTMGNTDVRDYINKIYDLTLENFAYKIYDKLGNASSAEEITTLIKNAMKEILFICQLDPATMHISGEGDTNEVLKNDIEKLKTIALRNTEDLLIIKLSDMM